MKIYIAPETPELTSGGVVNCVYNLRKALIKLGHTIVETSVEADIVHGHAFDGSPNVYTSHGVYPSENPLSKYNRELYRNISGADVVTAVSEWTAKQFGFIHVDPVIIHNGVDFEALQKYVRPTLDYVIWAKNSADELANPQAFIELAKSNPALKFVMTVSPEGVELPDNVRVIGIQPYQAMMGWMAGALALVSTGTENFPLQPLEAMAMQVPVIALPRGGVQEMKGIFLTEDLELGLDIVLANRGKWIAEGLQSIHDNYTWEIIAKQYLDQYEKSAQVEHNGEISVVIPCYNLADQVVRAVESCLKQSHPPKEIIVVDDGSTDNPAHALLPYSDQITLIKLKNGGVSRARNVGIEHATGEFICCLDADDAITSDFLAATHKSITSNGLYGIAYTGINFVEPKTFRILSDLHGESTSIKKLSVGNGIPCCNLFRKKAWKAAGGYKNINPSWEDYDLWLSILEIGFEAKLAGRARLLYTASPNGRSGEEQRGNHPKLLRATVDGYHSNLYGNSGLVTFVIPCYNQWKYVYDAVKSCFEQTYPHIEVIVVDDASTDEPSYRAAVGTKILRDFPKTKFYRHEENGGLSASRNTGINLASGAWIVPLDADDKVAPEFVAECLKVVYNTSEFAYTDIFIWHDEGKGPLEEYDMSNFDPDRLRTNHQHACTILYKKTWAESAGLYDEQMRDGWEDYEFDIRMVKSGHCGIRVPKRLFYYRYREDGMRLAAETKKKQLGSYIWDKHKDVAQGASLMGCCGGKAAVKRFENPPPGIDAIEVPEGTVLMQYQGLKAGTMSRQGGEGRIYNYNVNEAEFLVHEADVMVFSGGPFVVAKTHQQTVDQIAALNAPPPEPPKDVNEVFPEGDDDLEALGEMIDPAKAKALQEEGLNTYQRLVAAPEEQMAKFFSKRDSKKVRTAAIEKLREAVGV